MDFKVMQEIARNVAELVDGRCGKNIQIDFMHTDDYTMQNIHNRLTEYRIHDLHIHPGCSYFMISKNGNVLYAVNVSGDSYITAATELMDAINRKF